MQNEVPQKLHCYVEKDENQWVALCLDFTLAAQADSQDQAIAKLRSMINDYIHEVIDGELKDHRAQFLNRRAPMKYWLKYFYYSFQLRIFNKPNKLHAPVNVVPSKAVCLHR